MAENLPVMRVIMMLNPNTLQKYTGVNATATATADVVWLKYPHTASVRGRTYQQK